MEKSYQEIRQVLQRLTERGAAAPGTVLRGSKSYLAAPDRPVESQAARDLVERAMADRTVPLYVMAIGAVTNVASAILMEPKIRERIVVIWLGGQPEYWHTAREFNLKQDLFASQLIFDSGAALVRIPCKNVSEQLKTTVPELEHYLKGRNPLCDYLCEITREYMVERGSMSKVIWDISTVAWLRNAGWVPSKLAPSPILTSDFTWSFDGSRHFVRLATDVDRDAVFGDLFRLLAG